MKVKDSSAYNAYSPEAFRWQSIDSPKLERIASAIAAEAKRELTLPADKRFLLSGLRLALCIIADSAEL